jgi:HEAT repeat protein
LGENSPAPSAIFNKKEVRNATVEVLGQIGHANPEIVLPALLDALKDEDWEVRQAVAKALGLLGHANPQAVVLPLLETLKDAEALVKRAAVIALGQVSHTNPQTVIAALLETLTDKNIRQAALYALGQTSHADPQTIIHPLLEALKDEKALIREAAVDALRQVGHTNPRAVILPLLEALKDGNMMVGRAAIEALQKYDLSSYLKSHPNILDPALTWRRLLTSTPLTSLITCYKNDPSQSYIYSAAITKKCIENNLPIFQLENAFCCYEQDKLCTIDLLDIRHAHSLSIQIEKRVPQYPAFSDEICSIQ